MAETKTGLRHNQRVAWRKVADEAVILDVDSAVYYSLAGSGLRMWELIGEGKTVPEIAAALAEEYDAPEEEIARDCSELIRKLRAECLIDGAN